MVMMLSHYLIAHANNPSWFSKLYIHASEYEGGGGGDGDDGDGDDVLALALPGNRSHNIELKRFPLGAKQAHLENCR